MTAINTIDTVPIELTVVLGNASMPIQQLLRMGRGAVIELDVGEADEIQILANNTLVAKGEVVVRGDRISVSVTQKLRRPAPEPAPVAAPEPAPVEPGPSSG